MEHEKPPKSHETLWFGGKSYDVATGRISGGSGETLRIRKQSEQVLAALAARPGEVIAKDDLVESVWGDIATTTDSLVQCIADIRRTLGTAAVETFPKRGYRLTPDDDGHPARRPPRAWLAAGIAVVFLIAVALLAWPRAGPEIADSGPVDPPTVTPDRTLAVLPFANLSGDPELAYFSHGLSEDLTIDLSKIDALTVIASASSFAFEDADSGFRQIAEALGVRYLVRGTVRHDGERVRINVSLVDPYDGSNLWAERFDRTRANAFDVQEEVTRKVVDALSLTLGAEPDIDHPIQPDAYYMLLRGLEPLRAHTPEGNLEARSYFARALELDPQYARAHANIALTYGRQTAFRYSDDLDPADVARGLEAAITAIQLDPAIPDAYIALGTLNLAIGEHDNALAAARHAIRLDPNASDAYALLAEISVHGGPLDEALAAIERAKLLHPRHPFSYDWIEGHVRFQLGQYDAAARLLNGVVETNPGFFRGLVTLASTLGHQGEVDAARGLATLAERQKPDFAAEIDAGRALYLFEDRGQRLADGLRIAGVLP